MDRQPVASSNLSSVGYDTGTEVLEIEFLDGSLYRYTGVPVTVYTGLMQAPSKGSYFFAHIRTTYSYQQLR